MKIKIKKAVSIIALFLFIGGILMPGQTSKAAERNDLPEDVQARVDLLLSSLNEIGDYVYLKQLKDHDGVERYYYIPFTSGGYLIYDTKHEIVTEYSTDAGNEYIEAADIVFYAGALQYYSKDGDGICDLVTGERIASDELFMKSITTMDEAIMQKCTLKQPLYSNTRAVHTINGTVPNYSHNPNGICGSTAAAMLLRWYDIYRNGKYVPTTLESSNGVKLINHLVSYIDGAVPGSSAADVFSGISQYCTDQGVNHPSGMDSYSDAYVVGRVDTYDTPFCLLITNHATYGNHWVTGYGYNANNGSFYAVVNNGWGNTNVSINSVYFTNIVW